MREYSAKQPPEMEPAHPGAILREDVLPGGHDLDLQPVGVFLIATFLSIPILAILASVVKEWFTMRAKQVAPARARELEQKLEKMLQRAGLQIRELEKSRKELEEKLESTLSGSRTSRPSW